MKKTCLYVRARAIDVCVFVFFLLSSVFTAFFRFSCVVVFIVVAAAAAATATITTLFIKVDERKKMITLYTDKA